MMSDISSKISTVAFPNGRLPSATDLGLTLSAAEDAAVSRYIAAVDLMAETAAPHAASVRSSGAEGGHVEMVGKAKESFWVRSEVLAYDMQHVGQMIPVPPHLPKMGEYHLRTGDIGDIGGSSQHGGRLILGLAFPCQAGSTPGPVSRLVTKTLVGPKEHLGVLGVDQSSHLRTVFRTLILGNGEKLYTWWAADETEGIPVDDGRSFSVATMAPFERVVVFHCALPTQHPEQQ